MMFKSTAFEIFLLSGMYKHQNSFVINLKSISLVKHFTVPISVSIILFLKKLTTNLRKKIEIYLQYVRFNIPPSCNHAKVNCYFEMLLNVILKVLKC